MSASRRNVVALTLGDPAGIGPEVVLKAIVDPRVSSRADVVVVGDAALLAEASRRLGLGCPSVVIEREDELAAAFETARELGEGAVCLLSPSAVRATDPSVLFSAKATVAGGRAAVASVREALGLVVRGRADALVTAPLSKEGLALAGEPWPGHTELLASALGVPDGVRMMLAGGPLRVVLATTHLALKDVPAALSITGVRDTLCIATAALAHDFGIARPRLALCALNPHASDGGRFGDEEARILGPAVAAAREAGVLVDGPLAADTLFARAVRKKAVWDAVCALYHDQGLIPLKLAAFGAATNVTLGLPIVRTSPDHGTAYDIAGRGVAEPDSLVHAVAVALDMVEARRRAAPAKA